MSLDALLDDLAKRIAAAVTAELRAPAADEWIPLSECGIPIRTLRAAIKRKELIASKVGREYRVRRCDVDSWIAGRRHEPKAAELSPADRAIAKAAAEGRLRVVGGRR